MGFIVIACGLGVAQFAIENLGRNTIDDFTETLLLIGAAAILLGYGFYAARRPNPVLDLRMFRSRTFSIAILSGSVIRAGHRHRAVPAAAACCRWASDSTRSNRGSSRSSTRQAP